MKLRHKTDGRMNEHEGSYKRINKLQDKVGRKEGRKERTNERTNKRRKEEIKKGREGGREEGGAVQWEKAKKIREKLFEHSAFCIFYLILIPAICIGCDRIFCENR